MTKRSVPEWVGATPDTAVPARVRLRVFERHGGECYLSGRKIRAGDKWDIEHKRAISLGGENRESNLAPALQSEHKIKTAEDRSTLAKDERIRKKHLGIWKPKSRLGGGKFRKKLDGSVVRKDD
jgi:5-methylcytosine-specific restriction endonuclease McrA